MAKQINQIIRQANNPHYSTQYLMRKLAFITHPVPHYRFKTNDGYIISRTYIKLRFTGKEEQDYLNQVDQVIPADQYYFVVKDLFDKRSPKYRYLGKMVRELNRNDIKTTALIQRMMI